MSYPTWQFDDNYIASLPQQDILNLFNDELDKSRGTIELVRRTIKDPTPEVTTTISLFEQQLEAMVASDLSEYEKLTKLQYLTIGSDGASVAIQPSYVAGRISGVRSLEELAVYTGCTYANNK